MSVWEYTPEQNKKGYFVDNKTDADRKYKFIISNSEYLKIRLSTVNAFIDLVGEGSKNGTNIAINEGKNSSSQNFRFVYLNNGRFKIYNENGKLLKLNSKTSANGTKVVLWDEWNGNNAQWVLISVKTKKALVLPNKQKITKRQKDWADMGGIGRFIIQSALNFGKNDGGCFDIPGNNHAKKGDNLQVWSLDEGTDRVYSVIEAKNKAYYNIAVGPARGTDLVVDVASNGYRDGTNIGVWKVNNKSSQNFYFKHLGDGRYRIFNQNGKVIALNNGSSQNGSNIITWSNHSQKSAEWYLLDVDTRKAFIPYPVPSNLSGIKSGNMPGPESRVLAANINDTYQEVNKTEQRIKALKRKEDTLSRLAGDEFTLIMEDLKKREDASILADKILKSVEKNIFIDDKIINISLSIGIGFYPYNASNQEELLICADKAMYMAKENGKASYFVAKSQ